MAPVDAPGGTGDWVLRWWAQILAAFGVAVWALRRWVIAPYVRQQQMADDIADLKAALLRACDTADDHSRKIDGLSVRIDRTLELLAGRPRHEDERG